MRKSIHVLLAATAATGVLLLGASSASANRLSIDDVDHRSTWTAMTLTTDFGSLSCPLTLAGSFHSRSITKTRGALVGVFTTARVASEACSGGIVSVLGGSLPWHYRYSAFTGTLPRITSVEVTIVGLSMEIDISGVDCLFTTSAAEPAPLLFDAEWYLVLIRWGLGAIDLETSGVLCELAGDVEFSGREDEIDDGTGSLIQLALI